MIGSENVKDRKLKLGSLFDGSGGFPLAGRLHGVEPVWASEIEPYPIAVTRTHFPEMKHIGDVSKVNGANLEPVDIITFGSPCQDMSVAGKRKGLQHEEHGGEETTRSGLFYEAVRIIKEMRNATANQDGGPFPRIAIWENVVGALSSGTPKGGDFRCVLEEMANVSGNVTIPLPDKWELNGEIRGGRWSVAWRVFDAQYWGKTIRDGDNGDVLKMGTPQRRRRIYLVADFDNGSGAGEILFEPTRSVGNNRESETAG